MVISVGFGSLNKKYEMCLDKLGYVVDLFINSYTHTRTHHTHAHTHTHTHSQSREICQKGERRIVQSSNLILIQIPAMIVTITCTHISDQ